MMVYIIKTGDQEWESEGETPFEAAVAAFKKTPPDACGRIVAVKPQAKRRPITYIATEVILKAAGMEVE